MYLGIGLFAICWREGTDGILGVQRAGVMEPTEFVLRVF